MFRIRVACVLLFLLLPVVVAGTYPLTVTDDLGRQLSFERAPLRIVSLAPSHTESVCALGACDSLVAVDTNSDFPPGVEDLRLVGDAFAPSVEAIVALEPDLVLADEYSSVHVALEPLGITVYAGTPQTYDEVLEFLRLLGAILGKDAQAAELIADIDATVATVAERVGDAPRPTVFIELDPTPYSVGPASYLGILVDRAGGANIVTASMGDFPQVDPEFIVTSDPDVIVLTDAPFGETSATVAARPGWGRIAAVADGRVYELSVEEANLLSRAGPRIGEAIALLARLFHPELF
ncbi:MAG TPA: ABC transporter substrate-binding protein [Trueperaceae bacterium]|nr:ABC transporter substrate-binding protein [Trueperaceae bacterium]